MKNVLYTLLLIVTFLSNQKSIAQTESFEWAKQITGEDYNSISNLRIDNNGNSIITGSFKGINDFDPGTGINNLVSDSFENIYLGKYAPDGALMWVKHFSSNADSYSSSLDLDSEGNILLGGNYRGTIDLDPGVDTEEFTAISNYHSDAFICKLDSLGNYIWAFSQHTSINSLTIDESNNLYSIGSFAGTIDFDPDTTELLVYGDFSSSNTYISKHNPDGQIIWTKQYFSTNSANVGFEIAIDQSNNVITSGYIKGQTDFDPTLLNQYNLNTNGEEDIYFCKLDSNGTLLWAKSIGGLANERPNYIITDPFNNIYFTGYYHDSIDVDPGAGIQNMNNLGDRNGFLLKLDSLGNYTWSIPYQGLEFTTPIGIAIDPLGNLYITGLFAGSTDFDPNAGSTILNSTNRSAFIQKITDQGELIWVKKIPSENGDVYGLNICVDDSFEVYTSGIFTGYTDFGIGTPNQILDGGNIHDIYIHKISQNISTVGISEFNKGVQYSISPNPATNFTYLFLGDQEDRQITLLDSSGKPIEQFRLDQQSLILDLSKYTPGIYLIHVEDKYGAEVLKLVVE